MILLNAKPMVKLLFLAIASGLLLGFGWPPYLFMPLLVIGFVPILLIEQITRNFKYSMVSYLGFTYLAFVIWNVLTCSWIYDASALNASLIFVINPLFTLLPFIGLRLLIKNNKKNPYLAFIAFYLAYEYFMTNMPFAYPLLNLGNGLAVYPMLVQWYEYTGVFGGSLWLMGLNVVIYKLLFSFFAERKIPNYLAFLTGSILFFPLLLSMLIYFNYYEGNRTAEVVTIHPSIDARTEKYAAKTTDLVEQYLDLTLSAATVNTDFVVWPESALPKGGWLEDLHTNEEYIRIRQEIAAFGRMNIMVGLIAHKLVSPAGEKETDKFFIKQTADKQNYATYTGGIQLSQNWNKIPWRSKEKLVPFEERLPYPRFFSFMNKLLKTNGGFSFSIFDRNQNVFQSNTQIKSSYIICYESLFGDFVRNFSKEGAEILFIGLNESWYKNVKGGRQFMHIAGLRAIENRRAVARSSNDGVSGFISQRGDILQQYEEFNPKALRSTLKLNRKTTFYSQYGDYLGKIAAILAFLIVLSVIYNYGKIIIFK